MPNEQGAAVAPLPPPERLQQLLFDAARLGRIDVLPALLQAGADIEARDAKGYTPLILASYNGHDEATAFLLASGASVDAPDGSRGNTALMGVAFKGYDALAAQLIDAGAAIDLTNDAGQTALMMAALFGHAMIVDQLLERGADPRRVDAAGNSAVSVAAEQGNASMVARLGGNLAAIA